MDLDPHAVALEATQKLEYETQLKRRELGQTLAPLLDPRKAPLYQRIRQVASYAIGGRPRLRDVEATVDRICNVCGMDASRIERSEPDSPIELVLQGALARAALEAGDDLSAMQLSLMSGTDRDYILSRAPEIPGSYRSNINGHRPWRFCVSEALHDWLSERERSVA